MFKYTEGQGSVSLSAALEGEQVVVRARDQAIGIAPEALPGVFDMFYQVETSRVRHPGGLGIGLSLVRRLVELHGGTVSAHSDGPGRDSELRVRLPVAAGAVMALPHRTPIPASQRLTRRVLVVDDDRFNADSLAMLLRRGGSELETAHDGVAAIEAEARFRPDVVLLDLDMPPAQRARSLLAHPRRALGQGSDDHRHNRLGAGRGDRGGRTCRIRRPPDQTLRRTDPA